jgi:NTE family protein
VSTTAPRTAFVLGGGGMLGAAEVGMLGALIEAGIRPDLVVGNSVGAINGAVLAANPTIEQVQALGALWRGIASENTFGGSLLGRLARLARSRTHIHSPEPLRRQLCVRLPSTFEELEVPFQCVAASIERATARWFDAGALVPAILASCAVPGLLPPVQIDGEHHLDGGLVHSIPLGRAIALVRAASTSCRSGASRRRCSAHARRGRSRSSPLRSAAATASSTTWRASRMASSSTCCRPGARSR